MPMEETAATPDPRVALLFTRYPVATETFLHREVDALKALGGCWDVLALWPLHGAGPERRATHTFGYGHLLLLLWWIPYWTIRKPRAMRRIAESILTARAPNPVNFFENLLGLGYALVRARMMERRYTHTHAVWASAPAAAAWALHELVGLPYSMAGHAYDLYEDGGDGWLEVKLRETAFIRTSTEAGLRRWRQLGAPASRLVVIRRGLPELPPFAGRPRPVPPYRLLAVGRMVEKMGYNRLLDALDRLRQSGLPFQATLVGRGPLLGAIRQRCTDLGLTEQVQFTGSLSYAEVEACYREADLFLFTGVIARSGDRAGFPNAIGEAMAWGVPVCATPVGAVGEGLVDGQTGLIARTPAEAAEKVEALLRSPVDYGRIRMEARQWAEDNFDARVNMRTFADTLFRAHRQSRAGGAGSRKYR